MVNFHELQMKVNVFFHVFGKRIDRSGPTSRYLIFKRIRCNQRCYCYFISTHRTVPEVLTGRPMQSRQNQLRQDFPNSEPIHGTSPSVQETANNATPSDPINRLAKIMVGMNNCPSAQTLMVRPVSTTTLKFDGKSEKFKLVADLFQTMITMQPDMTETMKTNNFH